MNNLKKIFFTSDTHYFHENAIKFDNRPFKDLEDMHEGLIKRFNATVPKDGVTWFLGDVSMGNIEQTKSILDRLNGTKICVLGNHDRSMNSMYQMGFSAVMYNATIRIAGQQVTMSHCPLRGLYREDTGGMRGATGLENWHGEHKNLDFSLDNHGQFNLHGHIHSPNSGKSTKTLGRQYDVGVPANNFQPVSISTIESWIVRTLQKEKEWLDNFKSEINK